MTSISIFPLISLLESSNHQDEEHSLIARYAARLAADAAVRYRRHLLRTISWHLSSVFRGKKSVLDEKELKHMQLPHLKECQSFLILWVTLLPQSKKVLGLNPSYPRSFLCGVCMFSTCLWGFSPIALVPTTIKDMYVRVNTPFSAPDSGICKKNWNRSLGVTLQLPTAPIVRV